MPTRKDPVIQYLISLSVVEKGALFSFLLTRGYGEETHEICRYFTGGGYGNEGLEDVSFSEKWGVKAKSRLKLALRKFLQEYISYTAPEIEAMVKDAKGCIRLGDFPKAMELLTLCLNHLVKIERFEDLYAVYRLGCEVEEKVATDAPEMEEWRKARRRYNAIGIGFQATIIMHRLWDWFMVSFQKKWDRDGVIDKLGILQMKDQMEKIDYPTPSSRANVQYCHYMSSILLILGDPKGVKFYSSQLISSLEGTPLLLEYFPDLYPKFVLHSLVANCEAKEKQAAMSDLEKLRNEEQGNIWRYIMGLLTISEAFHQRILTQKAETLFTQYETELEEKLPPRDYIRLLFFLLRNKILHNSNGKVRYLIQKIDSHQKDDIKLEILVYTRIIDILLDWEDGHLPLVKAKTKTCKQYLDRKDLREALPKAVIILDFFSTIRGNIVPNTLRKNMEDTIFQLRALQQTTVPEGSYLNFSFILEEKVTAIQAAL